MQKWEICRRGDVAVGKKTWAHAAVLLTPNGVKVIAQTVGYREDDQEESDKQRELLIAQLGLDGWEPMPLIVGSGSYNFNILWYSSVLFLDVC
jgi:hypothetical protein